MEARQKTPFPRISSLKNPSHSLTLGSRRNAYWALTATVIGGLGLFVFVWSIPQVATAFFGFFAKTSAAEEPVLIHDSKLALLKAATNSDPNPNKGAFDIGVSGGLALLPSGGPDGKLPEGLGLNTGGAVSDQISLYTVREGDTLSIIAEMHGVSVNTIKWANDIKDVSLIRPGVTLLILPVSGVRHEVKSGGTVKDVAKLYDADAEEIALYNGLELDTPLAKGDIVVVPGGNLAPSPAKTTAKSSSGATAKVVTTALPSLTGYFESPMRSGRVTQGIHGHNGIDVGAPSGTAVYAAAGGTVIVANSNGGYNGGYGNYIVISHDNGTQTLYAHLSSVEVSVGSAVGKGDHIGGVGNTGRSTGNHLHFEVRGAKNPLAH